MANTYPVIALVAHYTDPARIQAIADVVVQSGQDSAAIINGWASTVQADGGGLVQLTDAIYDCSTAVKVRRLVEISGSQWAATTLRGNGTWTAHDGSSPGGVIEPLDDHQDLVTIRDLSILFSGGADLKAFYANVASNTGFVYGDDSRWIFERVRIIGSRQHAFHALGTYCREWHVEDLTIFDVGFEGTSVADGLLFGGTDCEIDVWVGDATGIGIHMTSGSANNKITGKAYYCDSHGLHDQGARNKFDLEVQDNQGHGALLEGVDSGPSDFRADSNSYDKSPSGSITGRTSNGVHVNADRVKVSGWAKDKNEGSRGIRQLHGVYLDSGAHDCQVDFIAHNNFTAPAGGPGLTDETNEYWIVGRMSDGTRRRYAHTPGTITGVQPMRPAVGEFLTPVLSSTGTVQLTTANGMYLVPVDIDVPTSFDQIAVDVTTVGTGAGQVLRLGLYADDGTRSRPTGAALFDAGTLDATTGTGDRAITITQTLQPGRYWLAVAHQGTVTTGVTVVSAAYLVQLGGLTNLGNNSHRVWFQSGVSGALPSIGTLSRAGTAPLIGLRRS